MNLQQMIVEYLESKGWYFDWEYANESSWYKDRSREEIMRVAHAWTVPQWGEYWSSDHLAPVGPKPKKRRYEDLKDALWSQILREEEPDTYEMFFQMGEES